MKKTFLTCLAVVALFAIATGASAITCTIDQRPAATLLIPYFQATYNPDLSILGTGLDAQDTLVTIGNASSAPMIAHVSVFSERSELVLDFNIALTGFDIQSWSMASLLKGFLPVTPVNNGNGTATHVPEVKDTNQVTINGDVCQRNTAAPVYPEAGGYLRIDKAHLTAPTSSLDNVFATVAYPAGPFDLGTQQRILDSLDVTKDSAACTGVTPHPVDGVITNPIHGYVTIDHANYCNLSNPSDPLYWTNDAAGMENNLWGDYIFISGQGIGTMGFPAVAIEADPSLADDTSYVDPITGEPLDPLAPGRRTFYRRYVTTADTSLCNGGNDFTLAGRDPARDNDFDCGYGDQREPLGLKYAARWFDTAGVTSNFNVWRASSVPSLSGGLADLLGTYTSGGDAKCNASEASVLMIFFDEDENTVTGGGCTISPCGAGPSFQFPLDLETQRVNITDNGFAHPPWPAGWVSMEFFNSAESAYAGLLDQAYVTYDIQGPGAFLSAGVPAAQLDPTNCQPLLVPCLEFQEPNVGSPGGNCYGPFSSSGVTTSRPAIPKLVGTGP